MQWVISVLTLKAFPRGSSILKQDMAADAHMAAINSYLPSPLARLVATINTRYTTGVLPAQRLIPLVLGMANKPQVDEPIVETVAVDVVDHQGLINRSKHHDPNDSMAWIEAPLDAYLDVLFPGAFLASPSHRACKPPIP